MLFPSSVPLPSASFSSSSPLKFRFIFFPLTLSHFTSIWWSQFIKKQRSKSERIEFSEAKFAEIPLFVAGESPDPPLCQGKGEMIRRRIRRPSVVVITCTVTVKSGARSRSKEDDELTGRTMAKNGENTTGPGQKLLSTTSADNVRLALERMRQRESQALRDQSKDVFSEHFVPSKFSRGSAEYGTPPPGSLTEMRAKKAARDIAREVLHLCEVIEEYGHRFVANQHDSPRVVISFGDLFNVYQFISDKVVGMLLRARKHGMVNFEGEMLFQRRDEKTMITLLLSHEQIHQAIKELSK